jgi:hypothetical protein
MNTSSILSISLITVNTLLVQFTLQDGISLYIKLLILLFVIVIYCFFFLAFFLLAIAAHSCLFFLALITLKFAFQFPPH